MTFLELKVPPVAVTLLVGLGMWVVATQTPDFAHVLPWRYVPAIAFFVAGAAVGASAVFKFHRAGTTVNPLEPAAASSLVTTGIYRLSRNPMYLGLLLWLIGWAIVLSNVLAVLLLPVFVAYMTRFQIVPEERALLSKLGADFVEYKQSVRRWL